MRIDDLDGRMRAFEAALDPCDSLCRASGSSMSGSDLALTMSWEASVCQGRHVLAGRNPQPKKPRMLTRKRNADLRSLG